MRREEQELRDLYGTLLSYIVTLASRFDLDTSCAEDNPLKFIDDLRREEFLDPDVFREIEEVILIHNRAIRESTLDNELVSCFEERVLAIKRYLDLTISDESDEAEEL